MIDLTSMPEVLNPLSVMEPSIDSSPTWNKTALWIIVIAAIIIFCIWWVVNYNENKSINERSYFTNKLRKS